MPAGTLITRLRTWHQVCALIKTSQAYRDTLYASTSTAPGPSFAVLSWSDRQAQVLHLVPCPKFFSFNFSELSGPSAYGSHLGRLAPSESLEHIDLGISQLLSPWVDSSIPSSFSTLPASGSVATRSLRFVAMLQHFVFVSIFHFEARSQT